MPQIKFQDERVIDIHLRQDGPAGAALIANAKEFGIKVMTQEFFEPTFSAFKDVLKEPMPLDDDDTEEDAKVGPGSGMTNVPSDDGSPRESQHGEEHPLDGGYFRRCANENGPCPFSTLPPRPKPQPHKPPQQQQPTADWASFTTTTTTRTLSAGWRRLPNKTPGTFNNINKAGDDRLEGLLNSD